jgi:hypothetical protein
MTDFRHQAEQIKLARLLNTETENLAFLNTLSSDDLHDLRMACATHLLHRQRAQFKRVATASKLLPTVLLALIAERTLGPLLCARIAGEIDTRRAIDIALHLSPEFMAAAAIHMDTERARELTAALPITSVITIAQAMVKEKEFITLGDLVGTLPLYIIEAVVRNLQDGESLLRIAFFIENPERLNEIMAVLPTELLQKTIQAAADERTDLWPHALALMSVVAPAWQVRLANMACEGGADTLTGMINGVTRHNLWNTALPLIQLMTDANRRLLINLPVVNDNSILRHVLSAAEHDDLWHILLPLVSLMGPELQRRTARLIDELKETTIVHIVQVAHQNNLWGSALLLVDKMGLVHRALIAECVAECTNEAISSLVIAVREQQLWPIILPLITTMTEAAQRRFVNLPLFQDKPLLHDIITAADRHELWWAMVPLVTMMPENARRQIAQIAETLEATAVQRWSASLKTALQWDVILELMGYMNPEHRTVMALQISAQDDNALNNLLRSAHEAKRSVALLGFLQQSSTEAQHQLLIRTTTLDTDLCIELLVATEGTDLCVPLLLRVAELSPQEQTLYRIFFEKLPPATLGHLRKRCADLKIAILSE